MRNNCKLCNRESTISMHSGLISCTNPDCYMDEVEMPQEDWDSLMAPARSLSDIKAEAIRTMILEFATNGLPNENWSKSCEEYANKLNN